MSAAAQSAVVLTCTECGGDARLVVVGVLGGVHPQRCLQCRRYVRRTLPDYIACIPVRTVSVRNAREHWSVASRREAPQRRAAHALVRKALGYRPMVRAFNAAGEYIAGPRVELPRVLITRLGPRLMNSDNAIESLKVIRDAAACAMYCEPHYGPCVADPDSDTYTLWTYSQEKDSHYGVRVEIWRHAP
jgi:hypothetical protein